MRFVWAVVAFVLAAVLIGAGIAQRTIFMGPDTQKTQVEISEPAPFVLIDGDVLRANPGAQTLIVRGQGEIFGSYGRTADMKAWPADSDDNQVTLKKSGDLAVEHRHVEDDSLNCHVGLLDSAGHACGVVLVELSDGGAG